jgi:hypothetical protein
VSVKKVCVEIKTIDAIDAKPCLRCGDKPDAFCDPTGVNVFHLCGDRMTLAANYPTINEAVAAWNETQAEVRNK